MITALVKLTCHISTKILNSNFLSTCRAFKKSVNDVIMSRRAILNMNTLWVFCSLVLIYHRLRDTNAVLYLDLLWHHWKDKLLFHRYPDATAEELEGDNVCIICREEMAINCKKLPCNHIFHATCLRSWFQRQQTCPTCRMDVLQVQPRPAQQPPRGVPPAGTYSLLFSYINMWQ